MAELHVKWFLFIQSCKKRNFCFLYLMLRGTFEPCFLYLKWYVITFSSCSISSLKSLKRPLFLHSITLVSKLCYSLTQTICWLQMQFHRLKNNNGKKQNHKCFLLLFWIKKRIDVDVIAVNSNIKRTSNGTEAVIS